MAESMTTSGADATRVAPRVDIAAPRQGATSGVAPGEALASAANLGAANPEAANSARTTLGAADVVAAPKHPKLANRLGYIDALRAIAVITVLLYHTWMFLGYPFKKWWNPICSGYIGVDLFLVLSGFCLYYPIARDRGKKPEPTLLGFARRRARRILPPYYVAIGIFAAVALLMPGLGLTWQESYSAPGAGWGAYGMGALEVLKTTVVHVLLLQNLNDKQLWALDPPFWSLALEVNLYVAMPILVVLARKRGVIWSAALAGTVSITYRLIVHRLVGGSQDWVQANAALAHVVCDALPGKWFEFALGMWAADIAVRGVSDRVRFGCGWVGLPLLVVGLLVSGRLGQFHPATDLVFSAGIFLTMIRCGRPRDALSTWPVDRVMHDRRLIWLGEISYSIYLLHSPILEIASKFIDGGSIRFTWRAVIYVGVVLPLIVVVSSVFFRWFEEPFMNRPSPPSGGAKARARVAPPAEKSPASLDPIMSAAT